MNPNNLNHIFTNYIANFERINNTNHRETYKWQVTHDFRPLMDRALAADDETLMAGSGTRRSSCLRMSESMCWRLI